jgi:hypothetical protein
MKIRYECEVAPCLATKIYSMYILLEDPRSLRDSKSIRFANHREKCIVREQFSHA